MLNIDTKRILFLVQLPPPMHGVSFMNQQLISSELIRENFELDVLNFQFAKTVSGIAFYRDAFYVFLLKAMGARILLHLHGKGIAARAARSRWKRRLYRWVFKNTQVICLSKKLTADIAGVYRGRPYVVPNGIKMRVRPDGKKAGSGKEAPRIFYLSNFFTTKGILVLISALRRLKEEGYEFEARLAGAPGDLSLGYLRERIDQAGLSGCVEVVGPIYGPDKFAALQKADLFVHPTYNDAFPLVILEAMQCGLPVVSTYEGGIPSMVSHQETGFLVESRNTEMLEEKIAVLLEDTSLRRTMGEKGYARFRRNFTAAVFQENMHRVFWEALGYELPRKELVSKDTTAE